MEGRDALGLKEQLASRGIIVRHYSSPPSISGCLRISVGKPKHTDALRDAFDLEGELGEDVAINIGRRQDHL